MTDQCNFCLEISPRTVVNVSGLLLEDELYLTDVLSDLLCIDLPTETTFTCEECLNSFWNFYAFKQRVLEFKKIPKLNPELIKHVTDFALKCKEQIFIMDFSNCLMFAPVSKGKIINSFINSNENSSHSNLNSKVELSDMLSIDETSQRSNLLMEIKSEQDSESCSSMELKICKSDDEQSDKTFKLKRRGWKKKNPSDSSSLTERSDINNATNSSINQKTSQLKNTAHEVDRWLSEQFLMSKKKWIRTKLKECKRNRQKKAQRLKISDMGWSCFHCQKVHNSEQSLRYHLKIVYENMEKSKDFRGIASSRFIPCPI